MALSLQQLGRVMREDPREMDGEVLAWAVTALEERVVQVPSGTPAHSRYAELGKIREIEGCPSIPSKSQGGTR